MPSKGFYRNIVILLTAAAACTSPISKPGEREPIISPTPTLPSPTPPAEPPPGQEATVRQPEFTARFAPTSPEEENIIKNALGLALEDINRNNPDSALDLSTLDSSSVVSLEASDKVSGRSEKFQIAVLKEVSDANGNIIQPKKAFWAVKQEGTQAGTGIVSFLAMDRLKDEKAGTEGWYVRRPQANGEVIQERTIFWRSGLSTEQVEQVINDVQEGKMTENDAIGILGLFFDPPYGLEGNLPIKEGSDTLIPIDVSGIFENGGGKVLAALVAPTATPQSDVTGLPTSDSAPKRPDKTVYSTGFDESKLQMVPDSDFKTFAEAEASYDGRLVTVWKNLIGLYPDSIITMTARGDVKVINEKTGLFTAGQAIVAEDGSSFTFLITADYSDRVNAELLHPNREGIMRYPDLTNNAEKEEIIRILETLNDIKRDPALRYRIDQRTYQSPEIQHFVAILGTLSDEETIIKSSEAGITEKYDHLKNDREGPFWTAGINDVYPAFKSYRISTSSSGTNYHIYLDNYPKSPAIPGFFTFYLTYNAIGPIQSQLMRDYGFNNRGFFDVYDPQEGPFDEIYDNYPPLRKATRVLPEGLWLDILKNLAIEEYYAIGSFYVTRINEVDIRPK